MQHRDGSGGRFDKFDPWEMVMNSGIPVVRVPGKIGIELENLWWLPAIDLSLSMFKYVFDNDNLDITISS